MFGRAGEGGRVAAKRGRIIALEIAGCGASVRSTAGEEAASETTGAVRSWVVRLCQWWILVIGAACDTLPNCVSRLSKFQKKIFPGRAATTAASSSLRRIPHFSVDQVSCSSSLRLSLPVLFSPQTSACSGFALWPQPTLNFYSMSPGSDAEKFDPRCWSASDEVNLFVTPVYSLPAGELFWNGNHHLHA